MSYKDDTLSSRVRKHNEDMQESKSHESLHTLQQVFDPNQNGFAKAFDLNQNGFAKAFDPNQNGVAENFINFNEALQSGLQDFGVMYYII